MKKTCIAILATFMLFSCSESKQEEAKKEEPKSEKVELANVKDPICGMSVKAHYEDTAVYNGKVYGFCNVACKEEFKKNPEEYLKK